MEHERRAAIIPGWHVPVRRAPVNPKGDILEVNHTALEGAGHPIEEIRGKPFWTARWWQVSDQIREDLQVAIQRAAAGEFGMRWPSTAALPGSSPLQLTSPGNPSGANPAKSNTCSPRAGTSPSASKAEEEVARQAQELRVLNERLRELDRIKTLFFANASHEFRTPLTLILGSLDDALASVHGILPPEVATNLAISHRNALRQLKLVNTMLDFSRIEAGRLQASYQPTGLAAFTVELASNFRAAWERAGLRLIVDCAPLSGDEVVYVDRDMWEKIVLNLVSNAFKFTLKGEIQCECNSRRGACGFVDRQDLTSRNYGLYRG